MSVRSLAGTVGLVALALGTATCGARSSEGVGPGVLLIVVDALRADHLGSYGYDRDTSPVLDELARSGLRFEEVFACAPRVLPAHAGILTGCDPSVVRQFLAPEFEGLKERRWFLSERLPRLAVEFLTAGYATAAFVEHEWLDEGYGFGRGFQRYRLLDPASARSWEGPQITRVVDHFTQWLRTLPAGKPWFAYLHVNELERFWADPQLGSDGFFPPRPELGWVPPVANTDSAFFAIPRSRWRGGVRTLGQYEAAYDDQIRRVDQELGRLFGTLRRMGRFDSTSIHVVGSYGVQFGEAGLLLTAGRYSKADLGVPWVVHPRTGQDATRGRVVPGLVSTLDVMPTLLALDGLEVPSGVHGESQARVALDPGAPVAARDYVFASCGLQEGCAVIGENLTLEYLLPLASEDAQLRRTWSGSWEDPSVQPRLVFYDRRRTPYPRLEGEERSGGGELGPFRVAAQEWLRDMSDARAFLQAPAGRSGLDPAIIENLRARGLVGDSRVRSEAAR